MVVSYQLSAARVTVSFLQGSRPHYCINKTALRSKLGVDAACEEMLKEQQGCRFKKNAMTLNHGLVKVRAVPAARSPAVSGWASSCTVVSGYGQQASKLMVLTLMQCR